MSTVLPWYCPVAPPVALFSAAVVTPAFARLPSLPRLALPFWEVEMLVSAALLAPLLSSAPPPLICCNAPWS
ncbi:hypothetical protein D3C80_1265060 [compost metagenome]